MKNEIIILCNSPECLKEVSSGNWPDLHTKNIFTCNLAYTHFRTTGRHFNIFSDAPIINEFVSNKNWPRVFDTYKYGGIQFVFNIWDLKNKQVDPIVSPTFKANVKNSPIVIGCSSAIGALFYLFACEDFDIIHLVGYTVNEWEGLENVKELKPKHDLFNEILHKYKLTKPRECVYTYIKK